MSLKLIFHSKHIISSNNKMSKLLLLFKSVLITAFALCTATLSFAQNTVSGTVVDEAGLPVIGAGVVQKGTTNGTVTDIDGKFTISVSEGTVLSFSSLNYYSQELPAVNGMNVVLVESVEALDEIVVVGYGVQKKSDLTGAISTVKDADLTSRSVTSAEMVLQGKTAGVQIYSNSAKPGAAPSVRIRGISSNGTSDPLYVVDGRITSSINNIDPNDIQSMEVLKDAASAAIYGARAGNGVILITTKSGKGKGQVSYEYQLTSQSLGNVPEVMNAQEYMDYYKEFGKFTDADYAAKWDGKTDTDWVDAVFTNSIQQRHKIGFQGGNDKGSIYASLTYLDNDGMFIGDSDTYKRLTGMVNASYSIKPWLEFQTNNQIHQSTIRSIPEGGESDNAVLAALQLDPLTAVRYSADNLPSNMQAILNDPTKHRLLGDDQGYYGISQFNLNENVNPLIHRDSAYKETQTFGINGTAALNLKPIDGLVITSRLSYKYSGISAYGYGLDFYASDYVKQNYVDINATNTINRYYQWENFANYSHSFGSHDLTFMVGTSFSEDWTNYVTGTTRGSDTDLGVLKNSTKYYYFAYTTPGSTKYVSGGESLYTRNNSYYGRVSYNFKNKYIAQVSLRADAADTSILPVNTRWGYFPAASAGWTVTEEPFMDNVRNVMPYLKLRASWGRNGSTASLGDYMYASVIGSTGSYPAGTSGTYESADAPTYTGNNNLKWETSEQIDLGLDARFLDGRLTFSADWFNKTTKDLIVTGFSSSTIVGVSESPMNAGNIRNRGVELELGWTDTIGDFSYSVRGNVSTLSNKVTYLHPALENGIEGVTYRFAPITRFEKGYPAWHFYGYKFTGIDSATGEPTFEDVNGDGIITTNDKTDIGSGIPKVNYGLTLTANWKNLDLIVFGSGAAGHQIFCALDRVDYAVNKLKFVVDDRWTAENTDGTKPRANAGGYTDWMQSSANVYKADYFKIKQIQLGYTLPSRICDFLHISKFRIYGSLDDFFIFTNYPGFDPEVAGIGSSLGVDMGAYPNSRKVVLGVNLTF